MPKTNEKNRYIRVEKKLSDGTTYTNWHVDLDSLDSDIDWEHYERMDLKPGDMIITELAVMVVLKFDGNHKLHCYDCCLAPFNGCTLSNRTKRMLCDICRCNYGEGHSVYIEEVKE